MDSKVIKRTTTSVSRQASQTKMTSQGSYQDSQQHSAATQISYMDETFQAMAPDNANLWEQQEADQDALISFGVGLPQYNAF